MLSRGLPLLLAGLLAACTGDSRIESARVERLPQPVLDAGLRLSFSTEMLDALDHGVPLTLRFRLRGDLTDGRATTSRRIGLRWLPLSRQYQLHDLDTGATRNFPRRTQLLAALDRVRLALPAEWSALRERGALELSVALEVDALPAPLRLPALLSRHWRIDPPLHRWTADN
jgi:hypothetical protein